MPVRSFRGRWAELILRDRALPKGFPADIATVARRRLVQVDQARALGDLRAPPGNRLKSLQGELAGWYSIRINDQWRIVFRWTEDGPADVEIVDYH